MSHLGFMEDNFAFFKFRVVESDEEFFAYSLEIPCYSPDQLLIIECPETGCGEERQPTYACCIVVC